MTEPVVVSASAARRAAETILVARGVPPADAEVVARNLVAADLRGIDTHGLFCLIEYAHAVGERRINPTPAIVVERTLPWAIRVDGDNGLGPLVAERTMDAVLETVEQVGIAVATVRDANHYGAAAVYIERAAERGCIALASANAIAMVAPVGAKARFFGTNPLAAVVPAGKYAPFVLDMATSDGALRKVRKFLAEGQPIPAGWATDADGNPTTDAAAAIDGMLLPFGGAKGSGLAYFLDILTGVLNRGLISADVRNNFTNHDRPAGNGHFFLAFKISAFLDPAEFARRMESQIARLHALPTVAGVERVRYPGERVAAIAARRAEEGIPYPRRIVDELVALGGAESLGV
ncbi:putative Malate dehydrogenase [uncultured Alphaproteobacteria bacterium]|uniref:Putative Malate dehydrogenase n=1 Tax=uncultured Alphaproteobacteria bacterium TaxID=91750 RepID=A0A212K474_9PROT|nr:putative Malate dehydrogenase [uncultured Alphaproteobacteria bacterium]